MATHRDRLLLGTAVFVLTANVVLNLIFIPIYGFEAAATISVITERRARVFRSARSERGPLPTLGYLPPILAATAAMTIAVVFLGDHALAGTLVGGAAYTATLLFARDARDVVLRDLAPPPGGCPRRSQLRPCAVCRPERARSSAAPSANVAKADESATAQAMKPSAAEALKAAIRRSLPIVAVLMVIGALAVNAFGRSRGPRYSATARVYHSTTDLSTAVTRIDPASSIRCA